MTVAFVKHNQNANRSSVSLNRVPFFRFFFRGEGRDAQKRPLKLISLNSFVPVSPQHCGFVGTRRIIAIIRAHPTARQSKSSAGKTLFHHDRSDFKGRIGSPIPSRPSSDELTASTFASCAKASVPWRSNCYGFS